MQTGLNECQLDVSMRCKQVFKKCKGQVGGFLKLYKISEFSSSPVFSNKGTVAIYWDSVLCQSIKDQDQKSGIDHKQPKKHLVIILIVSVLCNKVLLQ